MKQDIITNIKVKDNEIRVMRINNEEYISLTDKQIRFVYAEEAEVTTIKELEKKQNQIKTDAEARKKAREAEIAKQQKIWQDKQNQAKKDAEARKKARQAEVQKRKDAWNTLIKK